MIFIVYEKVTEEKGEVQSSAYGHAEGPGITLKVADKLKELVGK